jgi:hypothetical protein
MGSARDEQRLRAEMARWLREVDDDPSDLPEPPKVTCGVCGRTAYSATCFRCRDQRPDDRRVRSSK